MLSKELLLIQQPPLPLSILEHLVIVSQTLFRLTLQAMLDPPSSVDSTLVNIVSKKKEVVHKIFNLFSSSVCGCSRKPMCYSHICVWHIYWVPSIRHQSSSVPMWSWSSRSTRLLAVSYRFEWDNCEFWLSYDFNKCFRHKYAYFYFPDHFSNLNFFSATHLSSQRYNICFRRDDGYCAVCFYPKITTGTQASFGLGVSEAEMAAQSEADGNCDQDFISVMPRF